MSLSRSVVCSSRSAYVSRLRRAFLLRVHPDRFSSAEVRAEQAAFVQAFHQRIAAQDFLTWQRHREDPAAAYSVASSAIQPCAFVMEKRDGSLLRETMALNDSVSNILSNMSEALKKSGAASIPLPPNDDETSPLEESVNFIGNRTSSSWQQPREQQTASFWKRRPSHHSSSSRDTLETFLRTVDPALITSRQQARWDAKTVATVARRKFGFVAVDATRTRWSSATVAALLRRFVAISNGSFVFRVQSFAPLRLLWCPTAREVGEGQPVDMYEGTLLLNPSATSVQWAHTLRLVTADTLEQVHWYRTEKERRVKMIQNFLGRGITLRKGYTCSSRDYFECLGRLSQSSAAALLDRAPTVSRQADVVVASGTCVVVEAEFVCRSRASITASGEIQVGASMSTTSILEAIADLETQARETMAEEQKYTGWSKDLSVQVQKLLGIQRVYRTSKSVSLKEFCDCLVRLLRRGMKEEDSLGALMSGHSLGIAATNHSCHIADDGSLVIPHNFA